MAYKVGYKLVRKRKDGTYGSLYHNRRAVLPLNQWLEAESHQTKGLKLRPFWHVMEKPEAPHLSEKGRTWVRCEIKDFTVMDRPPHLGGKWFLANNIRFLEELP